MWDLEKTYHLSFEKKNLVVWKDWHKYKACYQQILRESEQFQLFYKALWQKPFDQKRSVIRRLNDCLLPYNLWVDYQQQRITGPIPLLLRLQLRYIQEFTVYYTPEELSKCWQSLKLPPITNKEFETWRQLIVEPDSLAAFITSRGLPEKLGCLLYFEYQIFDAKRRQKFYESHKEQSTLLYQATDRVTAIVTNAVKIEREFTEILRIRFFYLLLEIWLGVPAAYFSSAQRPPKSLDQLAAASKKIKRELNLFFNCTIEELALALYSVLKRISPDSLVEPAFSLGLKLDGSYEETQQLCSQLNRAIQLNYPVIFSPVLEDNSLNYDLLIIEGIPPAADVVEEAIYLDDISFNELVDLADQYFLSKKSETAFPFP
ncbi:hypothetical protein [Enterococcus sp. AZ109]|uniref:hypothetical protein n=1 Tax=Enterococcus sp. AZ109 TaxID=2774634 RepID=UPI003F686676